MTLGELKFLCPSFLKCQIEKSDLLHRSVVRIKVIHMGHLAQCLAHPKSSVQGNHESILTMDKKDICSFLIAQFCVHVFLIAPFSMQLTLSPTSIQDPRGILKDSEVGRTESVLPGTGQRGLGIWHLLVTKDVDVAQDSSLMAFGMSTIQGRGEGRKADRRGGRPQDMRMGTPSKGPCCK